MLKSEAVTVVINLYELHFKGSPKEHRLIVDALKTLNDLVNGSEKKDKPQVLESKKPSKTAR